MADLPAEQANKPLTPEVTWAQRSSADDASKNFIWITILASDIDPEKTKLDVKPDHVTFGGYSTSKKANYEVTLDFYAEIDPAEAKVHHNARAMEMKLQKKDLKEEFWPRLLKENKKCHFLKTDFDKWVDEDEQDGVPDDDYMNQFGGAGGAGGMPGMGADGGFGGLDFSKLGGAGGMPDMSAMGGMGGMGGEGEDEDDDDDEDMPALEEDENAKPATADPAAAAAESAGQKSKIEEVE